MAMAAAGVSSGLTASFAGARRVALPSAFVSSGPLKRSLHFGLDPFKFGFLLAICRISVELKKVAWVL